MAKQLCVWIAVAVVLSGCGSFGRGLQGNANCQDTVVAGGLKVKVCQAGGSLRVQAPGGIDPAQAAAIAQSAVDVTQLPVATAAMPVGSESTFSDCRAANVQRQTTIQCALTLKVASIE